ncbi:MAG: hypothetical protein H0V44_11790 [Planctomycetes bacterium]|nr:hypothetical protein [Planctomycetota bacterium]
MRIVQVLAFACAVIWLTGNLLVIVIAPTLFAHAPPKAPANGVSQDIVSHQAAGAIFGDLLHASSRVLEAGPIPGCVIATVLVTIAVWRSRRILTGVLCSATLLVAASAHAWGSLLQTRMASLLASLLEGTTEGSGWSTFSTMHRQAEMVMGGETVAVLVLAIVLAVIIACAPTVLPNPTQTPTL